MINTWEVIALYFPISIFETFFQDQTVALLESKAKSVVIQDPVIGLLNDLERSLANEVDFYNGDLSDLELTLRGVESLTVDWAVALCEYFYPIPKMHRSWQYNYFISFFINQGVIRILKIFRVRVYCFLLKYRRRYRLTPPFCVRLWLTQSCCFVVVDHRYSELFCFCRL